MQNYHVFLHCKAFVQAVKSCAFFFVSFGFRFGKFLVNGGRRFGPFKKN